MKTKNIVTYLILLFVFVISQAQNSEKKEKSASRRFADSLYYIHTIKPKQQQEEKEELNSKLDISKTQDAKTKVKSTYTTSNAKIPSSTLYESTWYNERVKVPSFSFKDIPDEIILRLIDPDKGRNFCFPIKKRKSSSYGWRWGRPHSGIDIALNTGDPICAAFDGVVRLAKPNGGYGNCIVIRHYNNLETLYGHLSKILVNKGDIVRVTDVIGIEGNTGHSTGSHLHICCRPGGIKARAKDVSQLLKIPNAKGVYNDGYTPNVATHTVVRGDTLWGIALKYLGNGSRYTEIMQINGLDRDIIYVGQNLKIPKK
jgi:murein DD-endopeptidase MepM/ murein hydrolase activator NlpD